MKRLMLLFAVFLLTLSPVSALEKLTYYVNDEAGVISPEYESKIASVLTELKQNTSVEMAVATVSSLGGEPIEEYSINLAHNVLGEKGKDNGLLILIAVDDREWRIEVGYGLEPYITDAMAGRIGREIMVPYFQQGNYEEGLYRAVLAISSIIKGEEGYEVTGTGVQAINTGEIIEALSPVIFFMIFLAIMVAVRAKNKKKEDALFDAAFWAAILLGGRRRGGGIGGFSGGSFGGFGGGGFGGGGAGGRW
ncbi:TPM domain-containing protein [Candidatus Woesearchaeota archaeon]|nr:TPM domain-containing protein [Candidatus Woesearchaeota archaeon]